MTDLSSYPVRLAEDISSLLRTLNDHLTQASPSTPHGSSAQSSTLTTASSPASPS